MPENQIVNYQNTQNHIEAKIRTELWVELRHRISVDFTSNLWIIMNQGQRPIVTITRIPVITELNLEIKEALA